MRSSLLLLAAQLWLAGAAAAEPIERILAVVDGAPILLSEVRGYTLIRGVSTEAAVEALIDEQLMLREAGRLPESAPTPQQAEAAFAELAARLDEAARQALDEGLLRRLSSRQATILRYVALRFQPQVRVTEDELREAWEREYRPQPSPPAFDEVRAALAERLERRALDARIEAWVAELREAASVRYNPEPRP
jgi:hypothetical protein